MGTQEIVDRYVAVWSEPDAGARRKAIGDLWAPGGTEFVEGVRFTGHPELADRVAEAYGQFVEAGGYTVSTAGDVTEHGNIVMFTIRLERAGEVAWAARVFLVLGEDGLVHQDYQLTVQPLDPG